VKQKSLRKQNDPSPVASRWDLTRRENEVLDLLRTGASDKEIARALGVSRSTASKHVENILKKMKVPQSDGGGESELAKLGPIRPSQMADSAQIVLRTSSVSRHQQK
jgi:DNA-binding NarL/FixJ family response regulator